MRYADGGGLTAAGRAKREAVRFEAPHAVAVRDSKDPDGPILCLAAATWAEFTASLG
ncbi:DUF397 domain-containing protein [Streptomyces sp. NEAU-W12]|uniref:DUF397 domain-containing protein n=1 Tax=Streptomyces sp. NEAU-W12 TaxID=2994668 RepID=UPI00224A71D3|nr:DUF397 domain-containing protein [Streptomyces sp. NEAU-W12]MCX2927648.1 DUF397 domain-containing protein [Streptomyces sp. NEAU-W12]